MATVDCVHCGGSNPPPVELCVFCLRGPLPCHADLRIGGLDRPLRLVDRQPVVLGRMSPDDRVGRSLNQHNDVGRRHAEVILRCDQIEIRDNDSRFGTFAHDERLPTGTARTLPLPLVIRLGTAAVITVERAR